ncbi:hypothetical protein [Methylobacterium sp. Leaf456]|uniref:hypothetical protein n=1 Tax=Methylobacterium sp. Leaf456 TaxID=1736382 RepID=UPI0012E3A481|nr:hypothetical protein [Methylobacterium sp. Leaf456]
MRLDHADRPEGGPFVAKIVFVPFRSIIKRHRMAKVHLRPSFFSVSPDDRLSQPTGRGDP